MKESIKLGEQLNFTRIVYYLLR